MAVSESELLKRAILENCLSRMVAEDVPLLNTLLREVFSRGQPGAHSQSLSRARNAGSLRQQIQRGSLAAGVQRGSIASNTQRSSIIAGVQRSALSQSDSRATRSTEDSQAPRSTQDSLQSSSDSAASGSKRRSSSISDQKAMRGAVDPPPGHNKSSAQRSAVKANAGRRSSLSDQQSMRGTEDLAPAQHTSGATVESSQSSVQGGIEQVVAVQQPTRPKKALNKPGGKVQVLSAEELAAQQAGLKAREEALIVQQAVEAELKSRNLQACNPL